MALDPAVEPAAEAPDKYVLSVYAIHAGIADENATEPAQPYAYLRFAKTMKLMEEDGQTQKTNALGSPAYRYAKDGAGRRQEWEYYVQVAVLAQAILDAGTDIAGDVLAAAGLDPAAHDIPTIVAALAAGGQPEAAIRRAAEGLESDRQAGTLEVSVTGLDGAVPPVAGG